jgi:hypothetical protein
MEIEFIQEKIEKILPLYIETKDSILVGFRIDRKEDRSILIVTCCDFDGIGKSIRHYEFELAEIWALTPEQIAESMNKEYEEKLAEANLKMKAKIKQMNIEEFIRTGKRLGIEDEARKLIRKMYDMEVKID